MNEWQEVRSGHDILNGRNWVISAYKSGRFATSI
jgi:hypothetical protein